MDLTACCESSCCQRQRQVAVVGEHVFHIDRVGPNMHNFVAPIDNVAFRARKMSSPSAGNASCCRSSVQRNRRTSRLMRWRRGWRRLACSPDCFSGGSGSGMAAALPPASGRYCARYLCMPCLRWTSVGRSATLGPATWPQVRARSWASQSSCAMRLRPWSGHDEGAEAAAGGVATAKLHRSERHAQPARPRRSAARRDAGLYFVFGAELHEESLPPCK